MGLDREKLGKIISEVPRSSKGKTHFFKENRGYGDIRALCNRLVNMEQLVSSPEDVECKRCRKTLREMGVLD